VIVTPLFGKGGKGGGNTKKRLILGEGKKGGGKDEKELPSASLSSTYHGGVREKGGRKPGRRGRGKKEIVGRWSSSMLSRRSRARIERKKEGGNREGKLGSTGKS